MLKKFAYIIGTGLGSGYVPGLPGTAGSLLALLIYYLFPLSDFSLLLLVVITFFAGIWSSGLIERDRGIKDPQQVTIDEWAGQWAALLFLPRSVMIMIAAFLIFRITDIFKPFPVRNSQAIKGGWGIMIDDLLAAAYTQAVLRLILLIYSGG